MTDLFERTNLPVGSVGDAAASARAITPYDPGHVVAVRVIEKASGAPDKDSVEQHQEEADQVFAALEEALADVGEDGSEQQEGRADGTEEAATDTGTGGESKA